MLDLPVQAIRTVRPNKKREPSHFMRGFLLFQGIDLFLRVGAWVRCILILKSSPRLFLAVSQKKL